MLLNTNYLTNLLIESFSILTLIIIYFLIFIYKEFSDNKYDNSLMSVCKFENFYKLKF